MKFFERCVGCTGRHDLKLFKKRVKLDVGKFSFVNRVCDEWNKLPEWVVNLESMNEFKGNLDHYLRENIIDEHKHVEMCCFSALIINFKKRCS